MVADGDHRGRQLRRGQCLAVEEGVGTYLRGGHTAHVDGLQLLAAVEHASGDGAQAVGQLDALQALHRRELRLARECHVTVAEEGDMLRTIALIEGIAAERGEGGGQRDVAKQLALAESPLADEGQSGREADGGQALAAATDRRSERGQRRGQGQFLQRLTTPEHALSKLGDALGHAERRQLLAHVEGIAADARHGLGLHIDGLQQRAVLEGILADSSHLSWDGDGGQCLAMVKCTVADAGHVGRDGDDRQPLAVGKRILADGGQRGGQRDVDQHIVIIEHATRKGGHTLGNGDRLQLFAIGQEVSRYGGQRGGNRHRDEATVCEYILARRLQRAQIDAGQCLAIMKYLVAQCLQRRGQGDGGQRLAAVEDRARQRCHLRMFKIIDRL